MGKKFLGFIIMLVLMFNITYKYWLPNQDRRAGDPEFMVAIQSINTQYFKVSPEETFVYCYLEDPGGDYFHRSLWLAIPSATVIQIRALSNQEIQELKQQAR